MRRERRSDSGARRVCFVTGTRAEFGLMRSVLHAIEAHPRLQLQLIATGMHLNPAHGDSLGAIRDAGFSIDRTIPWSADSAESRSATARATGFASMELARAFAELGSQVVLIVGDRVEAFAAAAAAHISGIAVAHVHGGDRAAGQVDDALRHAITKLSHIYFPATRRSADRIFRLGEERWRIVRAGSPGLDGIQRVAASFDAVGNAVGALKQRRYALLLLHPVDADETIERKRAATVFASLENSPFHETVVIYPNNDPGSRGIMRYWDGVEPSERWRPHRDLPRELFLGLLRDAAVLIGNSSSGIIEAASFGTPVIDIGPRQLGRERGPNVVNVPYSRRRIIAELSRIWNGGRPIRIRSGNVYGGGRAGERIAAALAAISLNDRTLRKLIRY